MEVNPPAFLLLKGIACGTGDAAKSGEKLEKSFGDAAYMLFC